MARKRTHSAWILAACAAVVAQAAPQAWCRDCDRPCHAARADRADLTNGPSVAAPAAGCPLCTAATRCHGDESNTPPCRCQLSARQDQPLSSSRELRPVATGGDSSALQAAAPPPAPPVLGISREYAAALLSAPIRPPRILFGVWRN